MSEGVTTRQTSRIGEPALARFLFGSPYASPIWLLARIYIGYLWLHAGWEKVTGTSGDTWTWHWALTKDSWLRTSAGLKGFAAFALSSAVWTDARSRRVQVTRVLLDSVSLGDQRREKEIIGYLADALLHGPATVADLHALVDWQRCVGTSDRQSVSRGRRPAWRPCEIELEVGDRDDHGLQRAQPLAVGTQSGV